MGAYFVAARARRHQLQMKPVARPGQRTQYRAGVAVAITGAATLSDSAVALRKISRRGCCRGPADRWIRHKEPQGKGEKGRAASDAPDAECRHADMELRVCWGPAVILDWTAVNFWHGNPVVMAGTGADKKCPRPSKHRLTNRLDAWLFLTILFFIRYTYTPATA